MNEDQWVKLIFKLALLGFTIWAVRRLARGLRAPDKETSNDDNKLVERVNAAIEKVLGGVDVADKTAALIEERRRVAGKVRWTKRIVWMVLAGYAVLVPLRNYFNMPSGFASDMALGQILFVIMSIGFTINYLVTTRMARASRVILVLRRFREHDHRRTVLPRVVGSATAGIAVPITIVDSSFPGESSPWVQILGIWLIAPATLLVGSIWIFFMPLHGFSGVMIWFVIMGLVFWLLFEIKERLAVALGVTRTTEENFQRVLSSVLTSIRRRKGKYAGTMALKFPDSVWKSAIRKSLVEADAVLVDVTEISASLEWELLTVKELVPAERVVLAWSIENVKQAADQDVMAQHLSQVLGDETKTADDSIPSQMPARLFERLDALLSKEWIRKCQMLPYEKSVRQSKQDGKIVGESGLAVCIALAHKEC